MQRNPNVPLTTDGSGAAVVIDVQASAPDDHTALPLTVKKSKKTPLPTPPLVTDPDAEGFDAKAYKKWADELLAVALRENKAQKPIEILNDRYRTAWAHSINKDWKTTAAMKK